MQIKPITTFDINGMPIISQEEFSEARAASDPATRKIFNAILSDDVSFISNEIANNRLDINDYIIWGHNQEIFVPLFKFCVCRLDGEVSISYNTAKYLLDFPDLNVNAYGSSGKNALIDLCSMRNSYWADACLPSSSMKQLAILLVNDPKIKLNAIEYEYNYETVSYIPTENTANSIALKVNNTFMSNIISDKLNQREISNDFSPMLVNLYQEAKKLTNQEQLRLQSTFASGSQDDDLPEELKLFKATFEEAKKQVNALRFQNN